ncbi:UreD urease accessory protein-domain-containing protein [Rhodotorula diobovata]|uniref:UreD urease accessory protein-domain-containing protein n=1 Tax=Rhodotorula diobovata TaxID=5288 RepID=A0A5C5FYE1_9BASI|nr:UreD urease accessory protein-domain-containing protein [Rhodotorula diobovata]
MQRRLSPGDGVLRASLDPSSRAHLSDVQFSYPLKVIVPARRFLPRLQCVYVIGYGGGLVAGDRVRLKVEVDEGVTLVMLTQGAFLLLTVAALKGCPLGGRARMGHRQRRTPTSHHAHLPFLYLAGSTKVFKVRPGRYLSAPTLSESSTTQQLYRLTVQPRATLVVLPAPVTCFSRARYTQRQVVRLAADGSSSLVLLDWYTSGRMDMGARQGEGAEGGGGEEWEFERYRSENEVWIGDKRVAKDVLLLEDEAAPPPTTSPEEQDVPPERHTTTYRSRVAPYSCYATLFLFGPSCTRILASLEAQFGALVQHKQRAPFSLVWSFSPLATGTGGGGGGIARCAGDSTEAVREWVTHVLGEGGIEELVSRDLWKTAFN